MQIADYILALIAAMAAGFVNAVAGGGTLISFPVLVALGIPPVAANVTNTIALCPGYFGGTYAQRNDFLKMKSVLWILLPTAVIGGVAGGVLLIYTPEKSFQAIIPYLILLATIILALQKSLKKWVVKRNQASKRNSGNFFFLPMIFVAAVYGGYFGAGLGVILMAVLGLLLNESLVRINALKQATSFSINIVAALYFCFSGLVVWPVVAIMIAGSLGGGIIGGKLALKMNSDLLRWIIILAGLSISLFYFID